MSTLRGNVDYHYCSYTCASRIPGIRPQRNVIAAECGLSSKQSIRYKIELITVQPRTFSSVIHN
jgi:hypothetical protein